MADEFITLDRESFDRLADSVRTTESRILKLERAARRSGNDIREDTMVGYAATPIGGRIGNTLGFGQFRHHKSNPNTGVITATTRVLTVFNVSEKAIKAETLLIATRHFQSGIWLVERIDDDTDNLHCGTGTAGTGTAFECNMTDKVCWTNGKKTMMITFPHEVRVQEYNVGSASCGSASIEFDACDCTVGTGTFDPTVGDPCENFTNNTPSQIQVEISGVVNSACSDCGDFNETHLLDQFLSNACNWLGNASGMTCNYTADHLSVAVTESGGNTIITFEARGNATGTAVFTKTLTGNPVAVEGMHTLSFSSSDETECDWTGATVTVNFG